MKLSIVVLFIIISSFSIAIYLTKPSGPLSCNELGYLRSLLVNSNSFIIAPEILNKTSVTWSHPNQKEKVVIIDNGNTKAKIPNVYGENTFIIKIKNQEPFTKRHFKSNWWHSHQYSLNIKLNLNVVGCDGL